MASGANGRTDDVVMTDVNKAHANVLKKGAQPKSNDAEKVKAALLLPGNQDVLIQLNNPIVRAV